MNLYMTGFAQRPHVTMAVTIRMALWQMVVRMFGSTTIAGLADRALVEEEAVPLLPRVRFAGAVLCTPCLGVAHLYFPFTDGPHQHQLSHSPLSLPAAGPE